MTRHLHEIFRFACVGTLAAGLHIIILWLLVHFLAYTPLIANIFAFCCAFILSYCGHKYWTFQQTQRSTPQSLWRFWITALMSFILNESLYFILMNYAHFNYLLAIVVVLIIVPPFTFILSKWWAFAK